MRILTSLKKLARNNHEPNKPNIRLWCSGQKTNSVVHWMKKLGGVELAVGEDLFRDDVSSYLSGIKNETLERIPNELERLKVEGRFHGRARANFRWAYMMKNILEDPELTRELYATRLEELMQLDKEDRENGKWLSFKTDIIPCSVRTTTS